jgi:hypothetical protein
METKSAMAEPEFTVIPVIEESALVTKRIVDRSGVRITKLVHEREETIDGGVRDVDMCLLKFWRINSL